MLTFDLEGMPVIINEQGIVKRYNMASCRGGTLPCRRDQNRRQEWSAAAATHAASAMGRVRDERGVEVRAIRRSQATEQGHGQLLGADLYEHDPLLSGRACARPAPDRTEMALPLSGLLVVSVEQAVAAPQCTCRLADAGARVIKVERPEGDFARDYDHVVHGESANFVWLNRGKQSVVLDLGKAEDKALLEAMPKKADVFVQNLKPGALAKLGFPMSRLRKQYPRLICCSISGYGESGPYAQRKAYDLLISLNPASHR